MGQAEDGQEAGRVRAPPRPTAAGVPWPLPPGLHPLGMGGARDGRLRVPPVPPGGGAGPVPLVVMLRGYSLGDYRPLSIRKGPRYAAVERHIGSLKSEYIALGAVRKLGA